ncbi:hypothetical protein KSP35_16750 [Aquihabitans sp. G128]|uniref:hypothetical protein n=1 Tax=Aquihabitans sp. G128 TaxID=2849779 RepID=UPI001C24E006|nr:hypothetical protein [Aquihabitans sp. G128]QXC60005.1 hypothetical protein KSP35_16750 [Aquihabitans sp. G128]
MLYVAWEGSGSVAAPVGGPWSDVAVLQPGLLLVDSEAGRSAVYHGLKDLLPPETPLLVGPLADDPKFSRMAPGTTAWLRDR